MTINWQSNFEVKKLTSKVTGGGNMNIVLSAYLREKCHNSRKTKTIHNMTPPFYAARFVQDNSTAK